MWPMIIFPLYVLWSLSRELIECCDMRYSNLYVLWQLADFKITAQRLFDQDRASPTLWLHLTLTHLPHFLLISPLIPSLTSIRCDVMFFYQQASKIFGCMCPKEKVENVEFSSIKFLSVFLLRHQWVCVLPMPEWWDMYGWSEPVLLCLCQRLDWSYLSEPRANM